MKQRFVFSIVGLLIIAIGIGLGYVLQSGGKTIISPIGNKKEKPLDKYSINNLSKRIFSPGQIVFDEATATTSAYTVYTFHYVCDGKKVTGVAHLPNGKNKKYPVIVQFRGYADQKTYVPGDGTAHSAEVYAANGYISIAPDFLGYGGSASPSANVFEERFQTYTTALQLLSSIGSIPFADETRVGIWGHSNGGQIALTVLEVTGKPYPTTLWAPVSKPFPYSILYYTDEASDHGKLLRRELARFEEDYDAELFSLTNYVGSITAPIQIHQGGVDEPVPQKWSDTLVDVLEEKNIEVAYFVYPDADHNMLSPSADGWNTVVSRDLQFFKKYLP